MFLGTPAGELMGVKSVMRKLSRGVVRRGRQSSVAKGSVVGAAAGLKAKPRRGEAAAARGGQEGGKARGQAACLAECC